MWAASLFVVAAAVWLLIPRHTGPNNQAKVEAQFGPTIVNSAQPPGAAPHEMAWIPGGEFSMGANDPPDLNDVGMKATLDARPIHRVYVDGFFMDKTDVTNAEFARFVAATGYVTVAERTPSRLYRVSIHLGRRTEPKLSVCR